MDHPLEIATTGDKIRPRGANGKIFGLSGSGGTLTGAHLDKRPYMLPTGQAGASV
jgi:hypothetical protein